MGQAIVLLSSSLATVGLLLYFLPVKVNKVITLRGVVRYSAYHSISLSFPNFIKSEK